MFKKKARGCLVSQHTSNQCVELLILFLILSPNIEDVLLYLLGSLPGSLRSSRLQCVLDQYTILFLFFPFYFEVALISHSGQIRFFWPLY